MADISISRSVPRSFAVLEYFRKVRAPCTTPELGRLLRYPYTSVRAILQSLHGMGYLEYHAERETYFPTPKLMSLGSWVQEAMLESEPLKHLLKSVVSRVQESAAISTPGFIFNQLVTVTNATRKDSLQIEGGVGHPLTNSASGRVLLSQMSEAQVESIIHQTQYWANMARAVKPPDHDSVMRAIEVARASGSLSDFGTFGPEMGTIAYAIPSSFREVPLTLLVSGPVARMKKNEKRIRLGIELYLAAYRARSKE